MFLPAALWLLTLDCWCNLGSQPKQMQSRKARCFLGTNVQRLGHTLSPMFGEPGTILALLNKVFPASMPGPR